MVSVSFTGLAVVRVEQGVVRCPASVPEPQGVGGVVLLEGGDHFYAISKKGVSGLSSINIVVQATNVTNPHM